MLLASLKLVHIMLKLPRSVPRTAPARLVLTLLGLAVGFLLPAVHSQHLSEGERERARDREGGSWFVLLLVV